jgi:hypothetical protein
MSIRSSRRPHSLFPANLTANSRPALLAAAAVVAFSATGVMAQPVLWPTSVGGNGNYFEVVVTPFNISWQAASDAASIRVFNGRLGRLASASTQEMDLFVRQLAAATPTAFTVDQLGGFSGPWIGGIQLAGSVEPNGGWTWNNGDTFDYSNWFSGEPNDNPGSSTGEDRIQLYQRDGAPILAASIQWNDLYGPNAAFPVRSYVVEYVVPSPSAAVLLGLGGVTAARRRR